MNIRHLEYFLAVVDRGSINQAADLLHLSQPALSQAIRDLERSLGVVLFKRTSRGVELTLEGTALISPAQQLRDDYIAARAAVRNAAESISGHLHVGVMPAIAGGSVSEWIATFVQIHSDIKFRLHAFRGNKEIKKFLDRGPAELVIAHDARATADDIVVVDLGCEDLMATFPPTIAPPDEPVLSIESMKGMPLIMGPPESSMHAIVQEAYREAGVALNIAVETDFMESFGSLVRAGVGVAFLPKHLASALRAYGVQVREVDPPIRRVIRAYYKERTLSKAGKRFLESLSSGPM